MFFLYGRTIREAAWRLQFHMICRRKYLSLSFFFLFETMLLGVESWFERMCEGMIRLQMAVFCCVCVFLCLRTHVSRVCCKVMSVSTNNSSHVTLSTHWLTQPLQWQHRSLLCVYPLTNTILLLNVDGIAPSLSLYLFSFISFSFSESKLQPLPLPPSFFPFPWGLCALPSRA